MLTHQQAVELKRRYAKQLLAIPGVAGLGIEKSNDSYHIAIYLIDESVKSKLPTDLDSTSFRTVITGCVTKH